jgi:hypothetical protein
LNEFMLLSSCPAGSKRAQCIDVNGRADVVCQGAGAAGPIEYDFGGIYGGLRARSRNRNLPHALGGVYGVLVGHVVRRTS